MKRLIDISRYVSLFGNHLNFYGACDVASSACIDVSKQRATVIKTYLLDISFVDLSSRVVIIVAL